MRKYPIILQVAAPIALVLCLVSSCCRSKVSIEEEELILLGVAQAGTKAIIDDEDATARLRNMIGQCYDGTAAGSQPLSTAGFGVYGYKQSKGDPSSSVRLFNDMRVYPADSRPATIDPATTEWTYAYPRYWDKNGSYQFIAYWPWLSPTEPTDGGSYAADIESDKTLYLRNIPNWQEVNANAKDFMTAIKTGSYMPDFYDEENQRAKKVTLSFGHILSQLEIRAYYIGSDMEGTNAFGGGVKVKKIMLSESLAGAKDVLYGSDATKRGESTDFKQRYDDPKALLATGDADNKIDLATSYMLMDKENETGVLIPFKDELTEKYYMWDGSANEGHGARVQKNDGPSLVGRWLMVPHTWQGINISVNFAYNLKSTPISDINPQLTDPSDRTKPNAAVPKTPTTIGEENYNYVLQPGKKYIITLVFDTTSGGITVKQIAVQDWEEHDVSFEYYNW